MRNPNNQKIPNLYIDSRENALAWINKSREMGLSDYLEEPRKWAGNGLTYAEAVFLEKTMTRYNNVMENKSNERNMDKNI